MPNRSTDALFQLVKSLHKSEKRSFKLFARRYTPGQNLTVQLFDALDKMEDYNEAILLKKSKGIKKQQLSNIKASLYRQILSSLRGIKEENNIDIQLHEQMDYARILYNKGLYHQSLRMLDRMKDVARENHQLTYLMQILFFEKKIEALHITRSMRDRADILNREADEVNIRLALVNQLSNLSLQLYSWYIKHGVARNETDERDIRKFFHQNLPKNPLHGFYEKLYLYQSYCWYAFIRQDFLMYYRYCQRWVDLFEHEKQMLPIETAHYIKGMHNLLSAHFDLQNHKRFIEALQQFEKFSHTRLVTENENNRIQTFVYLHIAKINKHFMEGTFTEGLKLVPQIVEKLEEYELYLDRHRIFVFYYKIASLYFGSGSYEEAIDFLNKIIHWRMDLRTDIQCYARLLHLISHFELGNYDLLDHLTKSVYRFMSKMENLSMVEEKIFQFLRKSFRITPDRLKEEFASLLSAIRNEEGNRFETRAFIYLDIVSWLESKLQNVPVQNVIRQKFLSHRRQRNAATQ